MALSAYIFVEQNWWAVLTIWTKPVGISDSIFTVSLILQKLMSHSTMSPPFISIQKRSLIVTIMWMVFHIHIHWQALFNTLYTVHVPTKSSTPKPFSDFKNLPCGFYISLQEVADHSPLWMHWNFEALLFDCWGLLLQQCLTCIEVLFMVCSEWVCILTDSEEV